MRHGRDVIEATEENFPGGFEDTELELVHFTKEEAKGYDFVQDPEQQGEPFIDEETGLRSYQPFGELIKEKAFRDLFLDVDQVMDKEDEHQPVPHEYHHMHAQGQENIEKMPWIPAPSDEDPEVKELAKKGRGGDTIIVLMPRSMIYLLGLLNEGIVRINPQTQFPEFGWKHIRNAFKSTVRVVATVGGALFGGPIGAALGSVAGSAITGRKPKDWLPSAFKDVAYTSLANAGMNMLGVGNPMASVGMPSAVSQQGFSNLPQGGQPWGRMTSFDGVPVHQSGAASNQGGGSFLGNIFGQGNASPQGQGGGFMNNILNANTLPSLLNIASGFMAHKGNKELHNMSLEAERDRERRQDERDESYRRKNGFYEPLNIYSSHKKRLNDDGSSYVYEGDSTYNRPHYKEGGKVEHREVYDREIIRGKGDGTSDSIYTQVPADTFIVNAFTVSSLGNGDSESGERNVKKWIEDIERQFSPKAIEQSKKMNQKRKKVDVALSVGEIPLFPSTVFLIGGGDLEHGIKELEHLLKSVKAHRMRPTKGALPEEAHTIESYLKMGR